MGADKQLLKLPDWSFPWRGEEAVSCYQLPSPTSGSRDIILIPHPPTPHASAELLNLSIMMYLFAIFLEPGPCADLYLELYTCLITCKTSTLPSLTASHIRKGHEVL